MNLEMEPCMKACRECEKACLRTIVYQRSARHAEMSHIWRLLDCAETCGSCAKHVQGDADELSRKRRSGTVVSIDNETVRLATPPRQNARMECRDLSWALNQLPSEQREVVLLIGLEGLSYQTAAEVLGIPVGTVMSRLSRGRSVLRRLLDGRTNEPAQVRDDNLVQLRGEGQRANVA